MSRGIGGQLAAWLHTWPLARRALLSALHWWAGLALLIAAWSGLNAVRDQFPALALGLAWLPGMDAPLFWHVNAALAVLPPAIAYLVWRMRRPGPAHLSFSALRSALLLLLVTGLGLLSNLVDGLWWRLLHLSSALALIACVFWHIWNMWRAGGWARLRAIWLALPPRFFQVVGGLIAAAAVLLIALHLWQGARVVQVPYLRQEIKFDGKPDEAVWQRAATLQIEAWYGAPVRQRVPLDIKLFHDGFSLYMQVKWPDRTRSRNHLPMVKTEQGWVLRQNGWAQNDEQQFYEDKFALMLGTGRWDALRSVFLGGGGRGGHHGPDGRTLDVWHWKSVRNHRFANLDDAYFGPLLPNLPGSRRYTWGYASDPLSAGGFKENFRGHGLQGPLQPLRLPRDPAALRPFQNMRGDAQDPVLALDWHDSQPWHPALDTYPVGTVLPSQVWIHPNEGDRADVRAAGEWANGYWTLEMARAFDTGSPYDQVLADGVNLWFAVFDHNQTRHAWHLRPLRLQFAGGDKK